MCENHHREGLSSSLAGLVLMGGKSKRMGQDKAFLPYKGKPLYELAYEKLATICEQVYLSVQEAQVPKLTSAYPYLVDTPTYEGPMGGLISTLTHLRTSLMVLAVDVPLLPPSLLQQTCHERDSHQLATLWYNEEAVRWEPLVGIWEYEALATLTHFYEQGGRSFQLFLQAHEIKKLLISDTSAFKNVNEPSTYQELL
ncbi:MAG: molybdenum cofactor guanylyltransferase [Bacteroidota bacterium]